MNKPQLTTALAVTALLASTWAGTAQAQTQCPVGTQIPPITDVDNGLWEIEGPLVSYDAAGRTLRVFDSVIEVPVGQQVDTGHGKLISWELLTDPALNETRSILGGTIKGGGTTVDPDGDGCMNLVMNAFVFEFSEDVLVAPLTDDGLDLSTGTLWIAGIPVKMNEDPRLPSVILDINGNEGLTFADLQGFEGSIVAPEGYFENDTLRAIVIETDAFIPSATTDNVAIVSARQDAEDGELRIGGEVSPLGATHVDIYAPGVVNAAGTACDGTFRAQAALVADPELPTVAEFGYRAELTAYETEISTVCVASSGGGVAQRTVDQR